MYMRIIPALAGNTLPASLLMCSNRDHPRACGEHEHRAVTPPVTQGSSPRLRGTLSVRHCVTNPRGIIPALAGNTTVPTIAPSFHRDHPRACGEHYRLCSLGYLSMGSSPRLRGTLSCRAARTWPTGIIPALAGNTRVSSHLRSPPWDHPRACGEHPIACCASVIVVGSSPRLRGTLGVVGAHLRFLGIIPALAGNTRLYARCFYRCRDHPRACGEHMSKFGLPVRLRGSSPRLRGTLLLGQPSARADGIIPALAGNTCAPIVSPRA